MYQRNNRSFRPRHSNNGGGFHGRRRPKQMDSRFFVQKAVEQEEIVYNPKHNFVDFELNSRLKENVVARGYKIPTPIQDQAIPLLLQGKDLVGIAATGTGKTAAFLLPLINKVMRDRSQRALIVAPTRELAVQIEDEFKQFAKGLGLYSALCIGGVSINGQIHNLYKNPTFVIGTPGRLRDLEQRRKLNFRNFNSIVLDEVDRMLDMGFIGEVKYIVALLPSPRQSLFFSATLTDAAKSIMQQFLINPEIVNIQTQRPSTNIDQDVIKINGRQKVDILHDLLVQPEFEKVLVFGRTKRGMEKLSKSLSQRGFRVASIHGNKKQTQRQRAISDFKQSRVQCLLATDIASRGLDINNVSHVINFDKPESYEDYIHRIGRTGRAGKKGIALTFVE